MAGNAIFISKMSEEQQPESNLPAPQKRSGARRRGHRGGRGRRRPAPTAPVAPVSEQSAQVESPTKEIEPPIRLREEMPVRPVPSKPKFQVPADAPRESEMDGSAISQAVAEATEIVESLRQTLVQMEEVLELIEVAERQKLGDEREIESLRRALRQLHSRGRPERHERHEREDQPPPED